REREAQLSRFAQQEALSPFELSIGPLLRVRLVQLFHEDHALLVTMHHVCGDGWSLGLFGRELQTLYTAAVRGTPIALPELTVQYRDSATWQREALLGAKLDEQLAYWRRRLAGLPPLLELPLDQPRPAVQRFVGTTIDFELGPELSGRLAALGR